LSSRHPPSLDSEQADTSRHNQNQQTLLML
jgi:hypothetical protein